MGHAVEICSNFEISHGSAVAIGTSIVSRACAKLGICDENLPAEVEKMFKDYSLPTDCVFSSDELTAVALGDKKRAGQTISFILPYAIGDCRVCDMKVEKINDFIQKGL